MKRFACFLATLIAGMGFSQEGLLAVVAESEGELLALEPEVTVSRGGVEVVAQQDVSEAREEAEVQDAAPDQGMANVAPVSGVTWRAPTFSLLAREMTLREGLEVFGAAQGMSVVMSKAVQGVFSGEFKEVPSGTFLDQVTAMHNLIWYYDGASLHICGAGEVQTTLLSLRYMKAEELRAMLRELGVEDPRFPIRTTSNDELILLSGPPRYVALIAETIQRADGLREQRTFNEVETRLFPLQHTWADDVSLSVSGPESSAQIHGVATVLEELMRSMEGARAKDVASGEAEKADAAEASDPLKDEMSNAFKPIIRADNRLNAVLVRDVVSRMPMYERLIAQLDKPQRLIEIGVTVVELTREDALDWQLSLALEATKDDLSGGVGQNVANLTPDLVGRGLAGTATYIGNNVKVSGSLTALKEKGKARNISRTSLLTVNNLAARLSDTQSYHARVVGTEVASLEQVTAGTELAIQPRIAKLSAPDSPGRVWMTLELRDGGFETITVDAMPMTRESTLETQVSVTVGESILLAGYLRDIKEEGGWGIPYLRDIPIIGWLFGGASYRTETVQRLFILTPQIIDADQADMVRVQASRQRDISEAMLLEEDSDVDNAERREREAQLREKREIHESAAEEIYVRNTAERELRRMKREDRREVDHAIWEREYDQRVDAYKDERKELLREIDE